MSFYIQINSWSGGDQKEATQSFAKIFRLSRDEADLAMARIIHGLTWQFSNAISADQSGTASDFLASKGFTVELLPDIQIQEPSDVSADDLDSADDLPEQFEEVTDFPATPGPKAKPKPWDKTRGNRKSSKAGLLFILLLLVTAALSQTQFGKDQISIIGSKAKELMENIAPKPDANNAPPVAQRPQPTKRSQPTQTPQPTMTETPKTPTTIMPLEGIAFEGETSMQYPVTLRGCRVDQNQLNLALLRADLEQTQSDFFCKDKTVANPKAKWNCDFKAAEKMCPGKDAYSCARLYQCIPETLEFNKIRFADEIEDLENLENQIKTGLTDLTLFKGVAIDPENMDLTSSSVYNCYTGDVLRDKLLRVDLNQTQESSFCKSDTLSNPVGGWKCELSETTCQSPGEKFFKCKRSYQCVKESTHYNRAKFKQEIDKLS